MTTVDVKGLNHDLLHCHRLTRRRCFYIFFILYIIFVKCYRSAGCSNVCPCKHSPVCRRSEWEASTRRKSRINVHIR